MTHHLKTSSRFEKALLIGEPPSKGGPSAPTNRGETPATGLACVDRECDVHPGGIESGKPDISAQERRNSTPRIGFGEQPRTTSAFG